MNCRQGSSLGFFFFLLNSDLILVENGNPPQNNHVPFFQQIPDTWFGSCTLIFLTAFYLHNYRWRNALVSFGRFLWFGWWSNNERTLGLTAFTEAASSSLLLVCTMRLRKLLAYSLSHWLKCGDSARKDAACGNLMYKWGLVYWAAAWWHLFFSLFESHSVKVSWRL